MNWLIVAWISFFVYGSIFLYCLMQKQWTKTGLFVALFNMLLAFMNSVAPIRGWADPNYFGFSLGFLRVPQGPGVTLVSGAIFVGAVASFCIALLNKTGKPMRFVAVFNGLLAFNIGGKLVLDLVQHPDRVKIQLGEYLTIAPVPATLILIGVFAIPLMTSAMWATRRA
jgi:hypothetical protein